MPGVTRTPLEWLTVYNFQPGEIPGDGFPSALAGTACLKGMGSVSCLLGSEFPPDSICSLAGLSVPQRLRAEQLSSNAGINDECSRS